MRITLPFNLLTHLEGTGIAASFGLKNHYPENHTVAELSLSEAQDLLKFLDALAEELQARMQRMQKQATRSPLGVRRRLEVETRLAAIRRAAEIIGAKL
jgi:hypothetical protein